MSTDLFKSVDDYNYLDDPEFKLGLASILRHAQTQEQSDELELRARCFYYARCGIEVAIIEHVEILIVFITERMVLL